MHLPFSPEQFFDVFRAYNVAVWPTQIALLASALAAIGLAALHHPSSGVIISSILAALWAWIGAVYHLGFFTQINKLAYAFGAFSLLGAAIFFWHGVIHRRLTFRLNRSPRALLGITFVLFALALYPVWTSLSGHHYPAFPTFGLPCPTTLFTIGMLALLTSPFPRAPLIVPILWCLVGAQAAFLLDVQADLSLIAAALFGFTLFVSARRATDSATERETDG